MSWAGNTYNHYPTGWAAAFCTPFKMYKRYAAYSGGTCDMLIVSWPKGIKGKGIRQQYHHVIDIVPTVLDCLYMSLPNGEGLYPVALGRGQHADTPSRTSCAPTKQDLQYFNMLGSRGIWNEGWKADDPSHHRWWGNFTKDHWELYQVDEDRAEVKDLAEKYPEKLTELVQQWFVEAGKTNGLPLEDRPRWRS